MAKKIDTIAAGLNGLLSTPAASTPEAQEPEQAPKVKGNYKTVCYSIAPELADKIRYIAYWDRKKLNAVVAEALADYIAKWEPAREKLQPFDK